MFSSSSKRREASDLHVVGGVSQQPSEGDGVRDGSQVNEQDGRQRLYVESVVKVARVKRELPLDVQNETAAEPTREKC